MTAPTVPAAPALANVPNVELMHVGQWDISTGTATFTADDLRGAVAALDCPAIRRPVLKLGHTDPRFDGEPAIGSVANLGLAADDRTLVGDYVGMPGWMGDVIASAYPDRSIEGWFDFTCQLGHVHPFVLTAVALLGVTAPGIGTLQSLQDVAALYGVAASAMPAVGTPVAVTVHASRGGAVPNPNPTQVTASATTEDVRRAYYDDAPWSVWIEEIQLEPLQLIVIDDNTGTRSRVPVTIDASEDGEDAVSFGTPIQVVIRYEDQAAVAASGAAKRVTYASRAESRPQASGDTPQTPAGAPVIPPTNPEGADAMSDTLIAGLRERFGFAEDADESAILKAIDDAQDPEVTTEAVAAKFGVPADQVEKRLKASASENDTELSVLRRELDQANEKIGELVTARANDDQTKAADKKRDLFASAFAAGKIGGPDDPDRTALEADYDEAPAVVERVLARRAPGSRFPVKASGYSSNPDEDNADPAAGDDYWFPGARVPAAAGQEG